MVTRILKSILLSFMLSSIALAGYSGSIVFVDSLGTPIERYQGNHESIYVEVYDEDLSGSLDVLLSSDSDSLGETVTLQEIEDHLFRGSIPVDQLDYIAFTPSDDFD